MNKKLVAFALAAILQIPAGAVAQNWPSRSISLVVPYAVGGPVDTVARIVSARMSEILGQQIVVENYPGAGGMSGAARVAKAAPDGYSVLLSGSATLSQVPNLYKKPAYNPVTDFEHVVMHSDSARILITRPNFPAGNLAEFMAYSKANQATMQFGSAGAGSGLHICAVLLNGAMGTNITHVPYRGSALAVQDLIAGRIDFMTDQISTALAQIRGHNVRAIATMGLDRAPGLEELPTADEQGIKGLDCGSWGSFSLPKGTPANIVQSLAKASNTAVETPAVRDRLKALGVVVPAAERRTPEYLAKFVETELARWAVPIKASGVSAD
jgi:tripartite-type tricarboxylate transporter receptor subunit TctC